MTRLETCVRVWVCVCRSVQRRASYTNSLQPLRHLSCRPHTVVVVQCKEALRCLCASVYTWGVLCFLSHRVWGVTLSSHFHLPILIQLMSHCFVIQSDVTSRTHNSSARSTGQGVGPKVGYLGMMTSSRTKLCQNAEEKQLSSYPYTYDLLPEGHNLLGSSVDLHHKNQEHMFQSPTSSIPTDLPVSDILTCSASSKVDGAKTIITDPGKNVPLVLYRSIFYHFPLTGSAVRGQVHDKSQTHCGNTTLRMVCVVSEIKPALLL